MGTVLPTNRENLIDAVEPPVKIAPPKLPAEFDANELLVTVSGPPLSTMMAPPFPGEAELLLNEVVFTLYVPVLRLKSNKSRAPPPAELEAAVLLVNEEPLIVMTPADGVLPNGSPAE